MPLFFDFFHEILQKDRFWMSRPNWLVIQCFSKIKPNLFEGIFMNNKKKTIERIFRKQLKNLILYISISVLLIFINLLSMPLHLPKSAIRYILLFKFIIQSKVVIPPIKIIRIYVNQQSQHLTEQIPPKNRLSNESPNDKNTLNRIFRRNISISNSSNKSNSTIHDICIHSVPFQKCHLVECPTIVYPWYHRSIWTVVICIVHVQTYQIKKNVHEVSVENW